METRPHGAERANISRVEVYWHTIRYRTVILYAVVLTAIVLSSTYLIFPEASSHLLERVSALAGSPAATGGGAAIPARQARFVNLDGKVQVKKVNSVQWVSADYQTALDTGDLIQTGSDGVARINFADGTQYTVKSNTFVTVEENIVAQNRPTQVGVQIQSGQVDLQTGSWEIPGSTAKVSFGQAVASLQADSRAAVSKDAQSNAGQITVDSGSAELTSGETHEEIGQWQRATVAPTGQITKSPVLAPPDLLEPVNLTPIAAPDPARYTIHFSWKPVATAKQYEFQASPTSMFGRILKDVKVSDTSADISGFAAGQYFWRVLAIDDKGAVSEAGDPYQFTLAAQGKEQQMFLQVDSTDLEGNVVEINGRTEAGAALMINGETVPAIRNDGHFAYFTQPMARGSHEIVIMGQNRRGGMAIKRITVVIP